MMRYFALFVVATSALVSSCLPKATAFDQHDLATVASKNPPPVASSDANKRNTRKRAAKRAIENQQNEDEKDDRDLSLEWITNFFAGATSDNILALIADLQTIATDGTSCSNQMSTTRVSLISVVDPLEVVVGQLVDLTSQVLRLLDPIINIIQDVLGFVGAIFGYHVVAAIQQVLQLDTLLQTLESVIQGFAVAMGLGFDVLRAAMDGMFSVSGLVQGAADLAGLSANIATTAVNCCQTLEPFNFICEILLDAFATSPLIAPVVSLARDAVTTCPAVLQQGLSVFPDFGILRLLNDGLATVVAVTKPMVDAISWAFQVAKLPEQQDLCCTGTAEAQNLFRESLADNFGLAECDLAGPVIEATNRLLFEVMPMFANEENNLRQQSAPVNFTLPVLEFENGAVELYNRSCTLGRNWAINYTTKEYTVQFPALDFTEQLADTLSRPVDLEDVCNPNTLQESSRTGSCCIP